MRIQKTLLTRKAGNVDVLFRTKTDHTGFEALPPVPNERGGFATRERDASEGGVQDVAMDGKRNVYVLNRERATRELDAQYKIWVAGSGGIARWREVPTPTLGSWDLSYEGGALEGEGGTPSVGDLSVDADGHLLAKMTVSGHEILYRFQPGKDDGRATTLPGVWLRQQSPNSESSRVAWLSYDSSNAVLAMVQGMEGRQIKRYSYGTKTWENLPDIRKTEWTTSGGSLSSRESAQMVDSVDEISGGGIPKKDGSFDYQVLSVY